MTLTELFSRSPCIKCLVKMMCKEHKQCKEYLNYCKLTKRRVEYWIVEFPKLCIFFIILTTLILLIEYDLGWIIL